MLKSFAGKFQNQTKIHDFKVLSKGSFDIDNSLVSMVKIIRMNSKIREKIKNLLGANVRFEEPLAGYTTFKTGGPADIFAIAKTKEDVINILSLGKELSIPLFILGGGSNILMSDKGFRGMVAKNELISIRREGNGIYAETGTGINDLLDFCAKESLAGLEFMSGIYGTLGGAVAGNAGAYGHAIGEFVESLTVINGGGRILELSRDSLDFSYRSMKIKDGHQKTDTNFITGCGLKLATGDSAKIKENMQKILNERNGKMPDPIPSAGCFFRNIETEESCNGKLAAGKLLEEIGAKMMGNKKVGVHERHSNIIMNLGNAKSSDILSFAKKLEKKVLEKKGIKLEFEVKLVGEF